jgi:hypothetical protein
LIQETAFADSVIAHFGRSTAYWPTFATPSSCNRTSRKATFAHIQVAITLGGTGTTGTTRTKGARPKPLAIQVLSCSVSAIVVGATIMNANTYNRAE